MATCLGIRTEKIRATIELSNVIIKTPYVKAFNVDKDRQRLTTNFSATVEILASSSFIAGSDIIIYAGIKGNEQKIFTGTVKSITTSPSFDKAGYFVLTISGIDKMGDLDGRTFSRRLKSDGFALFVSIDGGSSNRPTRGASIDKKIWGGQHTITSSSPKLTDGDHTKVTKMPKRGGHKHGKYGRAGGIDDWRQGQEGGLGVHDHSDMNKGGPSFGVFSSD